MAYIEIHPQDYAELDIGANDIVEVYNDFGSTFAMAYSVAKLKRGQTFMMFSYVTP